MAEVLWAPRSRRCGGIGGSGGGWYSLKLGCVVGSVGLGEITLAVGVSVFGPVFRGGNIVVSLSVVVLGPSKVWCWMGLRKQLGVGSDVTFAEGVVLAGNMVVVICTVVGGIRTGRVKGRMGNCRCCCCCLLSAVLSSSVPVLIGRQG